MKRNEIDHIIQRKVQGQTADYPSDMWDKVEAQLPKELKRQSKAAFYYLTFGVAVLLLGIFAWWRVSSSTNAINQSASNTESYERHIVNNDATHVKDGDKLVTELSNTESEESEKQNEFLGSSFTTQAQNLNLQKKVVQSKNELSLSQLGEVSNNQAVNGSIENTLHKSRVGSTDIGQVSARIAQATPVQDLTEAKGGTDNVVRHQKQKSMALIPSNSINVSSISDDWSESLAEYRQDCPSFVDDPTGVYFDAYWSHDFAIRSLSTSENELEDHIDMRKTTESATYSYSAGLRMTLLLPNGAGLKTGLNYSSIQERFSYVDPESEMTRLVITIDTIDGMEVRDTSTVVIPGTRTIVNTNKYKSLDLPILLTYEWDIRKRMYMSVNAGVNLNLLFGTSGKIVGPDNQLLDLEENPNGYFKDNLGVSLFASSGIHYRWTKNIDLILEPNIRLMLKSAAKSPIKQNWITVGLATGARFHF